MMNNEMVTRELAEERTVLARELAEGELECNVIRTRERIEVLTKRLTGEMLMVRDDGYVYESCYPHRVMHYDGWRVRISRWEPYR